MVGIRIEQQRWNCFRSSFKWSAWSAVGAADRTNGGAKMASFFEPTQQIRRRLEQNEQNTNKDGECAHGQHRMTGRRRVGRRIERGWDNGCGREGKGSKGFKNGSNIFKKTLPERLRGVVLWLWWKWLLMLSWLTTFEKVESSGHVFEAREDQCVCVQDKLTWAKCSIAADCARAIFNIFSAFGAKVWKQTEKREVWKRRLGCH